MTPTSTHDGPRLGVSFVPDPLDGQGLPVASLGRLARLAEAAGLERVAVSDHLLFHVPTPDPVVALAAMAEATRRIRLATSVLLLPLHHPVRVAHLFATLDQLSGGRAELGVGVGGEWPADYDAFGVEVGTRGARCDESLEVIRQLWSGLPVSFAGRHFQIDQVSLPSQPVQARLPIVVGGRSRAALARAARFGDRWDGIFLDAAQLRSRATALAQEPREPDREVSCGMVVWASLGPEGAARERLAKTMSEFYQLPFTRFERFVVAGPPARCAEQLAALGEAGATDITVIPAGHIDQQLDLLAETAALLAA